jgi:hypothetical protein
MVLGKNSLIFKFFIDLSLISLDDSSNAGIEIE